MSWSKEWIVSERSITHVQVSKATQKTGATFQINSTKLYVPVNTLFINDNIKFLENIKQGFKRITTQSKTNNLDYLIDLKFKNMNRLIVLSFKNGNDYPTRHSFDRYYMIVVEIKDFNALIDNKPFFDQPVKNKQESYEKLIEMPRNDDYTKGNLLDYLCHQKYYKTIGIDLSRQTTVPLRCQHFLPNFRVSLLISEFPFFFQCFFPRFLSVFSYFFRKRLLPIFFSVSFLVFWVFPCYFL